MKNVDIRILAILVVIFSVLYIGVEPFAHAQMHKHVEDASFAYDGKGDAEETLEKSHKAIEMLEDEINSTNKSVIESKITKIENQTQQTMDDTKNFWSDAKKIASMKSNISNGKQLVVMSCTGCHGIKSQGFSAPMDSATAKLSFGVVPPDLSVAGKLYDKVFLAALISNPAKAMNVLHKFDSSRPHPMPQFYGMGGDKNQELADMVAYISSLGSEVNLSDKEVFVNACTRCHDMKYDGISGASSDVSLKNYMGSTPPDLSMMIRTKSKQYIRNFIYNPQLPLAGTSMPRVGLDEEATEQVINYLESIGDSKKAERERIIPIIVGFLVFLMILAYLWKTLLWKELKD